VKIFVASGIFHPDSGGPATYLYRLLPELQSQGHEIRALAYGDAPVEGYPYPLQRIPFAGGPLLRWWRYAQAYKAGANWADVIYINSLGLPRRNDGHKRRIMKIVGDYAWERCVTRAWLPPTTDIDVFQNTRYDARVEGYKRLRAREAASMDRIIVPSQYLRQLVVGWGAAPERVQVIYNALEGTHYNTMAKAEARAKLGFDPKGRYVLTAARLTAWKGVDYLIKAVAANADLDIRLVVAGDGPDLNHLRNIAIGRGLKERVFFLGKIPHEKMNWLMSAADYLALYSGYEGLSHTLLEALYAGTPVIASARGGNPEVVQDGVNGLLVAHPDQAALDAALRKAFTGDLQMQLAAGTGQGLDRFAWKNLVAQTVEALTTS
jgi:glycosyltransferase involved in cell wall biosynthesis